MVKPSGRLMPRGLIGLP
uniref:Uncharacterized protein n=1 Tax=Rhizophora mucronata TaxID=61149 RepID=A0A2P2IRF8_RHIMU